MEKWKKLEEKIIYNGFRKIVRKRFLMPDGRTEEFDIMVGENACGILALTKSNRVILARQFRPGTEKIYDELPAGIINDEETPLRAAKRELLEETGYTGKMKYIGSVVDSAYRDTMRHCILARRCIQISQPSLDENEFIQIIEKPIQEFIMQVREGLLTDAELAYRALDYLHFL